jgi:hypothetical protein
MENACAIIYFIEWMISCMQKIEISIDEWSNLIKEGATPLVRISLNGVSMQPLIRRQRDIVTIVPLFRELKIGDIVLFQRADGAYVVHRLQKKFTDSVQTLGDNCSFADSPISIHSVLGIITHVSRGKHTIHVDTPFARFLGRMWMCFRPIRNIAKFCFRKLRRFVKLLGGKVNEQSK